MMEYSIPSRYNPYPDDWSSMSEITSFCYTEPLCLKRKVTAVFSDREVDFIVNEPYKIKYKYKSKKSAGDREKTLIVPAGLVTDLVTIPCGRFFRGLATALMGIERTGPHLEATIIHDYLYVAWQRLESKEARVACREHWRFADELFRAGMKEAKKRKCAAWMMYKASRTERGWRMYEETNCTIFVCKPRFERCAK